MRLVKLLPLLRDQRGATAIEYALIASLISISILTAATTIGTKLNVIFASVTAAF